MSDIYPQVLREILVQHGRRVCDDPKRLKALLRDYLGVHPGEHEQAINLLVLALENRVAAELSGSGGLPLEMVRNRLAERLHSSLGLTEQAAAWAVAAWADVLAPQPAALAAPASGPTPVPAALPPPSGQTPPPASPPPAALPPDPAADSRPLTSVTEALDGPLPVRPPATPGARRQKLVWLGLGAGVVVVGLLAGVGLTALLKGGASRPTPRAKGTLPPARVASWVVLFRSTDPAHWDRDVNEGETRLAKPLSAAPEKTRYLRMRRGKDPVLIPISKDQLGRVVDLGRYGWNGTGEVMFGCRLLGIYDTEIPHRGGDQVQVRWGRRGSPWSGWGFGHSFASSAQGYCWKGETQPKPVAFEIAVTADELSPGEADHLLVRPDKPEPPPPAAEAPVKPVKPVDGPRIFINVLNEEKSWTPQEWERIASRVRGLADSPNGGMNLLFFKAHFARVELWPVADAEACRRRVKFGKTREDSGKGFYIYYDPRVNPP